MVAVSATAVTVAVGTVALGRPGRYGDSPGRNPPVSTTATGSDSESEQDSEPRKVPVPLAVALSSPPIMLA